MKLTLSIIVDGSSVNSETKGHIVNAVVLAFDRSCKGQNAPASQKNGGGCRKDRKEWMIFHGWCQFSHNL